MENSIKQHKCQKPQKHWAPAALSGPFLPFYQRTVPFCPGFVPNLKNYVHIGSHVKTGGGWFCQGRSPRYPLRSAGRGFRHAVTTVHPQSRIAHQASFGKVVSLEVRGYRAFSLFCKPVKPVKQCFSTVIIDTVWPTVQSQTVKTVVISWFFSGFPGVLEVHYGPS